MNWVPIIGCGLLGFGVVFLLVPLILRTYQRANLCRDRDFHHADVAPVPRFGGLALVGALLAVEALVAIVFPELRSRIPGRAAVILSSLAMFAIGFWDDLKPLGAKRKLAAQVLICVAVCLAGIEIETFRIPFTERIVPLHGWGSVITILWLVGITNLINLIDGVDGLAGGIAFMLMALLVYVGYQNGGFVFLTAGMSGALLAFLYFNFPPARIYLGDGGAYFLGFQIGIFSIIGSHKGSIFAALIAPLFVLALPIVDTGLAILRRGLRGLPVFRPDRRHIHHRLLSVGFSRRQVVLLLYGLTLVFLGMGFVALWSRGQLIPVLAGLALLVLLLCAGRLSFSREWFAVGRTLGNSLAMRREVQYALCLTSWLKMEGDRCDSLDDLYADFVCAAGRLGFSSVRLTLADGERSWQRPCSCLNERSFRLDLHNGQAGILELRAPSCMAARTCSRSALGREASQPAVCPHDDQALFEIMSELVAEGWAKAATRSRAAGGPLRFNSHLPAVYGTARRPSRQPFPATSTARGSLRLGDDSVVAS
jgi:UDP-GlcNAc:undecaprenyl-phosphate GlcNAc-1-phosphate transferase